MGNLSDDYGYRQPAHALALADTSQDGIVLSLYVRTRLIERYGRAAALHPTDSGPDKDGVVYLRWLPAGPHGANSRGYTRGRAASISRNLRKLREEGVVGADNRFSRLPGRRLTCVWLTRSLGKRAGERLTLRFFLSDWEDQLAREQGFATC